MTWTNNLRDHYFGSDNAFLNLYCRPNDGTVNSGTAERLSMLSVQDFRMLLWQTSFYLPNAHHASPKWSYDRPIVVIGDLTNSKKKVQGVTRVGFCEPQKFSRCRTGNVHCEVERSLPEKSLYFWAETANKGKDLPGDADCWHPWRVSESGNEQWIYLKSLNPDAYLPPNLVFILASLSSRFEPLDGVPKVPASF